jgi:hypothetical protein
MTETMVRLPQFTRLWRGAWYSIGACCVLGGLWLPSVGRGWILASVLVGVGLWAVVSTVRGGLWVGPYTVVERGDFLIVTKTQVPEAISCRVAQYRGTLTKDRVSICLWAVVVNDELLVTTLTTKKRATARAAELVDLVHALRAAGEAANPW